MREAMNEADYYAARPIIDPLRLLDCSPVGDGGVCMIVGAANDSPREVRITGAQGMRAGRDTFIFGPVGLAHCWRFLLGSSSRENHGDELDCSPVSIAESSRVHLRDLGTSAG